jgi:acetylornithine deacetylase
MPAADDGNLARDAATADARQVDAAIAGARKAIQARAGDWTRLLQDLIRIPSCFESEHAVVARVCEHVAAIGLTPILEPFDAEALRRHPDAVEPISEVQGRNNVVVRLPGVGGGRSLVLNCHLDVQPAGNPGEWTHPPFSGHVDTGTNAIFGRGAMDDKAGAAICLGLIRVLQEQRVQLGGDLVFHFVLEDEITGNGSLACLEAGHIADAAIILDGTRPDRAIDQHAGNMEFHIALKGRPASVSVSHMGANAAEMLSRTLLNLRDAFFRLNDNRQPPWTEFPSPYQLVIHAIAADAQRFCVPVEASARCHVTFPPPDTLDSMRTFLQAESRRHAGALGYPHAPVLSWHGLATEPVSCASKELRALVRETARRHGIADLRIGPSTGASDMRHFAKRGIPCLLYGPGRGFNPHRPNEYFLLDDLPLMMQVYLDMMIGWCNVAQP